MLSAIGAGLLLAGVVLMAAARSLYQATPKQSDVIVSGTASAGSSLENSTMDSTVMSGADGEADDDTASLATFIASEFSGLSPSSLKEQSGPRHRRAAASDVVIPAAQTLGAASA